MGASLTRAGLRPLVGRRASRTRGKGALPYIQGWRRPQFLAFSAGCRAAHALRDSVRMSLPPPVLAEASDLSSLPRASLPASSFGLFCRAITRRGNRAPPHTRLP